MYAHILPPQCVFLSSRQPVCDSSKHVNGLVVACQLQSPLLHKRCWRRGEYFYGGSWTRAKRRAWKWEIRSAGRNDSSSFGNPRRQQQEPLNNGVVFELAPWVPPTVQVLKGVGALLLLEKLTGVALELTTIVFPEPVALLTIIATVMAFSRGSARKVYDYYAPAITFFDKWLPIFFVPCVAGMALAPLPSSGTLIKATIVLAVFYAYSLGAAAFIVLDLQKFQGGVGATASERKRPGGSSMTDAERVAKIGEGIKFWTKKMTEKGAKVLAEAATVTRDADVQKMATIGAQILENVSDSIYVPPPSEALIPPFQPLRWNFLAASALFAPACFIPAMRSDPVSMAPGFLLLTSAVFRSCTRLPREVQRWLSPTVGAGIAMAAVGAVYGNICLLSWRKGITLYLSGAGVVLTALIGPAVAALGFKVHSHKAMLKQAILPLAISSILLVPSGLLLVAVLGRILALHPTTTLSIMPATTTLGLAIEMGRSLRADNSFVIAGVTILGAVGIEAGRAILDHWKVDSPVARGIAVGASSHAIGTSALLGREPQAGSVAGLAFAIKGTLSVIAISTPAFCRLLRQIAGA